jgi:hypothetical protein
MEKDDYLPPITISEVDGKIQISYDQVSVDIPAGGPVPRNAPPMVCRIFHAFMADLPRDLRAE